MARRLQELSGQTERSGSKALRDRRAWLGSGTHLSPRAGFTDSTKGRNEWRRADGGRGVLWGDFL